MQTRFKGLWSLDAPNIPVKLVFKNLCLWVFSGLK